MPDVRVIKRDRRDALGEGPLWSERDNAVYWTDILGRRVNRVLLESNELESWTTPDVVGWVIERAQGGFVAGVGRDMVALRLDRMSDVAICDHLATIEGDRPGNRLNDAKADVAGRIWAGTMPFSGDRPTGAFYRVDTDRAITRVDDGYRISNGPALSTDEHYLFHTDTALRTIFRFPVLDDGSLGARVPFIQFDANWGHPDGMAFDADEGLWVACWGASRVMRFDVDGKHERSIDLPASQITSCTFAGSDLDRMFVTSAAQDCDEEMGGALFEVEPGCRGRPTHMYRG
jgi:sugar lactone lactonase YvrE